MRWRRVANFSSTSRTLLARIRFTLEMTSNLSSSNKRTANTRPNNCARSRKIAVSLSIANWPPTTVCNGPCLKILTCIVLHVFAVQTALIVHDRTVSYRS